MSNVALENLVDKAENSMYKLVILASKRALEIAEGSASLVPASSEQKTTTTALEEIAEGKIKIAHTK